MPEALSFTLLSCGGTDPLAGAGILGDLATWRAHGVHGTAVVTAVTAQNAAGVTAVLEVPDELVAAQLAAVFAQAPPRAAKTGMLLRAGTATRVAEAFEGRGIPLVVDPVLRATAGGVALAHEDLVEALRRRLAPCASVVTPNLEEAEVFLGRRPAAGEEADAARALRRLLDTDVLLKGGHATGPRSVDWLATRDGVEGFALPRVPTAHGHGAGCALSAALAVRLARGTPLRDAVAGAKAYVHRALLGATALGSGRGPVRHAVASGGGPPPQRLEGPRG